MKILASADHHFDRHGRFAECIRVHRGMVEVAKREKIDLFLSAGDVFERASSPIERDTVAEWLLSMAELCPVVIAKGNHDARLDAAIMGRLKSTHPIIVIETAEVVQVAGATIAVMAWPDRSSILQAAGESGEAADDVAQTALRNVMRGLGDVLAACPGPRIALGHFMVDGAITSTGQPLLGQPIRVGLSDLELLRAQLGVMGHIHKAARYDVGGAPFFYTGSPFRTDYGQLEKKTILLAEFDVDRLVRTEEIDSGATPMVHFSGAWSEADKTLVVEWDEEAVAGAEVRLRYTVPRDQRTIAWSNAQEHKRAMLDCGAVRVKVEEVPVVVNRARAPAVARSKAIVDKLPAHWESIGFDPGDRRAAILGKAAAVEQEVNGNSTAPTWLRLNRASFHEFGPFKDFSFDLTHYPDQPIIAMVGKNGAGKCLPASSTLYGSSGPVTIGEVVREQLDSVLGYERGKICPVKVVNWHRLGEKSLLKLSSDSGWSLTCAGTHPILTARGWKRANDVNIGEFVAMARTLPFDGDISFSKAESELAGLLIGDACMRSSVIFCAVAPEKVGAFSHVMSQVFPGTELRAEHGRVVPIKQGSSVELAAEVQSRVVSAGHSLDRYLSGEQHNNVVRFLRGESGMESATVRRMLDDGVPLWDLCGRLCPS
jgi:DNA repair exonuclease SbcCD nuclease subunit